MSGQLSVAVQTAGAAAPARKVPRRKRRHTDLTKAAALTLLGANGGNVSKTAAATGIPVTTLWQWSKGLCLHPAVSALKAGPEGGLAPLRDGAVSALLDRCLERRAVNGASLLESANLFAQFARQRQLLESKGPGQGRRRSDSRRLRSSPNVAPNATPLPPPAWPGRRFAAAAGTRASRSSRWLHTQGCPPVSAANIYTNKSVDVSVGQRGTDAVETGRFAWTVMDGTFDVDTFAAMWLRTKAEGGGQRWKTPGGDPPSLSSFSCPRQKPCLA
jgi:hypothetical protein